MSFQWLQHSPADMFQLPLFVPATMQQRKQHLMFFSLVFLLLIAESFPLTINPNSPSVDDLHSAFNNLSSADILRFCMLCWALWYSRNQIIFHDRAPSVDVVCLIASKMFQDWHFFQTVKRPTLQESCSQPSFCTPMSCLTMLFSRVTASVDASIRPDGSCLGYGCVLRDTQDRFIMAMAGFKCGQYTIRDADGTGLKEALSWIKNKRLLALHF